MIQTVRHKQFMLHLRQLYLLYQPAECRAHLMYWLWYDDTDSNTNSSCYTCNYYACYTNQLNVGRRSLKYWLCSSARSPPHPCPASAATSPPPYQMPCVSDITQHNIILQQRLHSYVKRLVCLTSHNTTSYLTAISPLLRQTPCVSDITQHNIILQQYLHSYVKRLVCLSLNNTMLSYSNVFTTASKHHVCLLAVMITLS